jgi:protein O-GlcNAc transferase
MPLSNELESLKQLLTQDRFQSALQTAKDLLCQYPGEPSLLQIASFSMLSLRKHNDVIGLLAQHVDSGRSLPPGVYTYLGIAYRNVGDLDRAEATLQSGIDRGAPTPDLWLNLGNVQADLGNLDAAIYSYHRAIALQPTLPDASFNLAVILKRQGNLSDALTWLRRTYQLQPARPLLLGELLHTADQIADWADRQILLNDLCRLLRLGVPVAEPWIGVTLLDQPHLQRRLAENYAKHIGLFNSKVSRSPPLAEPGPINIAILSCDLFDHATTRLVLRLFENIDRSQFRLIIFDYTKTPKDRVSESIARCASDYYAIADLSTEQILKLSETLNIQIAIDLKGYTKGTRMELFAKRLAPVQIAYLGYPGTSAIENIDYLIADDEVIPIASEFAYSEKILRIPVSFQPSDDRRFDGTHDISTVHPAPGRFVFACFNNQYKITPEVFLAWMDILQNCENAILWLLSNNDVARTNLQRAAIESHVSPDRLIFSGYVPQIEHLARHRYIDLSLDTYPCGAHTTASDSVGMNIPILTLRGDTFASRVGSSLLRERQLDELIADNLDTYRASAIKLYRQPEHLSAIKCRLIAYNIENRDIRNDRYVHAFQRALTSTLAKQIT